MKIKLKIIPDNGPTEVYEADSTDDAIGILFEHEPVPVGMVAGELSTQTEKKNWLEKILRI